MDPRSMHHGVSTVQAMNALSEVKATEVEASSGLGPKRILEGPLSFLLGMGLAWVTLGYLNWMVTEWVP